MRRLRDALIREELEMRRLWDARERGVSGNGGGILNLVLVSRFRILLVLMDMVMDINHNLEFFYDYNNRSTPILKSSGPRSHPRRATAAGVPQPRGAVSTRAPRMAPHSHVAPKQATTTGPGGIKKTTKSGRQQGMTPSHAQGMAPSHPQGMAGTAGSDMPSGGTAGSGLAMAFLRGVAGAAGAGGAGNVVDVAGAAEKANEVSPGVSGVPDLRLPPPAAPGGS